ncbi:MAG: glycosyltransferase family 9 protein, partial [Elusimicrobiaceae bacterium]
VRTDRIGDVVLTTPALSLLRKKYPDAHLAMLVRPYTADIVRHNPDLNEVIEYKGVFETARILRRKKFDAAVLFFVDRESALTVFLGGVKKRIGPASKIWSLLLTKMIRQSRSRGGRHEADFNTELLKPLGVEFEQAPPKIVCPEKDLLWAGDYLAGEFGIAAHDKTVFIHPGSRGSAKDWPLENFVELARLTHSARTDCKFLFTGSGAELETLEKNIPRGNGFKVMRRNIELGKFCALIARANVFVTNSTGPLHIATALNVPTVSFFPPIKNCTPARWGPYARGHEVLMPEEKEWHDHLSENLGANPMCLISPEEAFLSVLSQLDRSKTP